MNNQSHSTLEDVKEIWHLDNFHGLLLHALGPGKLRPLLGFTRAEQGLETLLDIIHQVFGGIRIVQEILADDKLDRLLLRWKEECPREIGARVPIDRRSGRWALVWSGGTRRRRGGVNLIQ